MQLVPGATHRIADSGGTPPSRNPFLPPPLAAYIGSWTMDASGGFSIAFVVPTAPGPPFGRRLLVDASRRTGKTPTRGATS